MSERDSPVVLVPHYVPPDTAREFRSAVEGRLPAGALRVATDPGETEAALPDAEAVVTYRLPPEDREAASELRWIQALSAGVDHFDHEALEAAGIALTTASGVHAQPIAEQVLGYLLTFERRLHEFARQQRDGVWHHLSGGELGEKTVGVLGVGAIGTRVAELADAVGSTVLGTKRDLESVPAAVDEAFPPSETLTVVERSDYVVVAVPLTEQTRGLLGREEFRAMSSDSVVVNVARGEVIDEHAMTRALQTGRIGGAALDVFEDEPLPSDSPLWDLPNVLVTPHSAGSTPNYVDRCADLFVENYDRFRAGDLDDLCNRFV